MSGPLIDYEAIEDEIKKILDDALDETMVTVEEELSFPAELTPWVGIYLDRRDPSRNQYMSAGRRQDYDVRFAIWCWCAGMEARATWRARNGLVTLVERALMANRTLNGLVETIMLEGGDMLSGRLQDGDDQVGFTSGGEVVLIARTAIVL